MSDLAPEQQEALDLIRQFLRAPQVERPYFLLEGLAGTGKTHLLSALARERRGAMLCSPFGKAASNLSRKTGIKASTVHSAIYHFMGEDEETNELLFAPKIGDQAWDRKVALLDEHGTCGAVLGRDLMATGCRVVACGDPGQLPPVNDKPYFSRPDYTLQKVHRQAWDSAIIRQAHAIRTGYGYRSDGPDFQVIDYATARDVVEADILATWTNATRRSLNHLKRAHLGMARSLAPRAGEPVMALRNDHAAGLLNGAVYPLEEDYEPGSSRVWVKNEYGELRCIYRGWIEDFDQPLVDNEDGQHHPFAMAYAATVHKLIGSEFDRVLLVDEYPRDREDWVKWAYTGVTRAAKQVKVKV